MISITYANNREFGFICGKLLVDGEEISSISKYSAPGILGPWMYSNRAFRELVGICHDPSMKMFFPPCEFVP
jgi:hypothetical protein